MVMQHYAAQKMTSDLDVVQTMAYADIFTIVPQVGLMGRWRILLKQSLTDSILAIHQKYVKSVELDLKISQTKVASDRFKARIGTEKFWMATEEHFNYTYHLEEVCEFESRFIQNI